MKRLLKILGSIIVIIVLLVIISIFAITQFINPNDYKPQIEKLAQQNANINLNIKGDLGWTFWPSLGVTIGKTEARIGNSKQLFAGIQHINAGVAVWPLLFGNVKVDDINVDGLTLNLVMNQSGGNWEQIGPAGADNTNTQTNADNTEQEKPTQASDNTSADSSLTIPVTIPKVSIKNASITYKDNVGHSQSTIKHFNLTAKNLNLQDTHPFPLSVSFRYQDAELRADVSLKSKVSLDLAGNHYRLAPMTLDAKLAGATPKPVSIHLKQTVDANLDEGIVKVADMMLSAAGIKANGEVGLSGLNDDKLAFTGHLSVSPFDANKVMKALGEPTIETTDPKALSHLSVAATLQGPAGSLMVNPLTIKLDNSTLKGKAGLASLASGKIVFDLTLDSITLDGYLPPETDTEDKQPASNDNISKDATTPLSTAPLLPLDTLRSLNVDGQLRIGHVQLAEITGKDIAASVTANEGQISTSLTGGLMKGHLAVDAGLDATSDQPIMQAQGKMSGVQIEPAAKYALDRDLIKGIVNTRFNGKATGNSEKSLMQSATGNLDFELKDGTLRGANLHDALADGVNNLLGKYKGLLALMPQNKKLPRGLSKDTKIVDLTANGKLANQVVTINAVKAQLKKGNLNGKGWLSINNEDFDFHLGMQSPEFSDSPYLKGTNWPIRCSGNLNGKPAKWCRPDSSKLDSIAKQALANAAKHKIAEKLGIDAEGDTVSEMAKNAAKQKAEEEKKKAEKKAKKKVKNKLKNKLEGLFH